MFIFDILYVYIWFFLLYVLYGFFFKLILYEFDTSTSQLIASRVKS